MDNELFESYEAPEVYELGKAEELTLGYGEIWDDQRGGLRGFFWVLPEEQ